VRGLDEYPLALTLLARFPEADVGPFLDRGAQIPTIAGEEDREAVMVLGAGRGVLHAKEIKFGAVIGLKPARRLKRCPVETSGRIRLRAAPFSTSNCKAPTTPTIQSPTTPSSANCPGACFKCFDFTGSSTLIRSSPQGLQREIWDPGDA
jgi:hypothetical protein